MYCSECGTQNPTDAQFCLDCGVSQSTSSTWSRQVDFLLTNGPAAVKSGFGRYFDFKGRSSRAEYWWWTLFISLTVFGLTGLLANFVFSNISFSSPETQIYVFVAILISGVAVGIRRLHDLGKSGWWLLLLLAILIGWIILIIWFVRGGTSSPNQYGQRVNQTDKRFESNNKVITAVFIAGTLLLGLLSRLFT